jgi:hypothetical protein
MKVKIPLLATILHSASFVSSTFQSFHKETLFRDDKKYWDRILAQDVEGSLTTPPTMPPTSEKACLIKVRA